MKHIIQLPIHLVKLWVTVVSMRIQEVSVQCGYADKGKESKHSKLLWRTEGQHLDMKNQFYPSIGNRVCECVMLFACLKALHY